MSCPSWDKICKCFSLLKSSWLLTRLIVSVVSAGLSRTRSSLLLLKVFDSLRENRRSQTGLIYNLYNFVKAFSFFICLSYLISFRSWQQDSWRSLRLRGFSAQSNDAPSKSFGSSFVSLQILQSLAEITPFTTLSRMLKANPSLELNAPIKVLFLLF